MALNLEAGVRRAMIASLVSTGVDSASAEKRVATNLAAGLAHVQAAFGKERDANNGCHDDEHWRKTFQTLKIWTLRNA